MGMVTLNLLCEKKSSFIIASMLDYDLDLLAKKGEVAVWLKELRLWLGDSWWFIAADIFLLLLDFGNGRPKGVPHLSDCAVYCSMTE